MAVARPNNQADLEDYALLAVVTKIIASQFIFVKDSELSIEKLATSLLELELVETDPIKQTLRHDRLLLITINQMSTLSFSPLSLDEITHSTDLAQFDFSKVSEPYFNYLKAFLGKADWQIKSRSIMAPTAPAQLMHSDTPPLPGELWLEILSHLSFKDLVNTKYVNRFFNQAVDATPINEPTINTKHLTIAMNIPTINEQSVKPYTLQEFFAYLASLPEEQRKMIRANVLDHFNLVDTKYNRIYLPSTDTMELIYRNHKNSRFICVTSALGGGIISPIFICEFILFLLGIFVIPPTFSIFLAIGGLLGLLALTISAAILIYHAVKHDELLAEINVGIEKNKVVAASCLRFFDRVDLEVKKVAEKAVDPSLEQAGMTSLEHAGMTSPEDDIIVVSDDEDSTATNGYTLR